MAIDNATADPITSSSSLSAEETSVEISAAIRGLAEIFASVKGRMPNPRYQRYKLESIDGELVFGQTEVDAALETAIAELRGSGRKAGSGRRIIKLP